MGSMREEELFIQTQQQEYGGDGDDLYLELEKAITERKCRIVQKKQKLRLIINERKKQIEVSKSAGNENKCLTKELEEISNQKKLRVQNIKKAQESRATLETSLCDLNNKSSFEKAETKRKKDEYDAAIDNARKTWESYKEKYENFPLAKKLREVEVEIKKVDIEIKQAKMDVADLKAKKQLMNQIAERRFQLSVVKLAEKYFEYQKKVGDHEKILQKITEMKKKLADLKSGKVTKHQVDSSKALTEPALSKEQQVVRSPVKSFLFTSLGAQVISPPPADNEDESSGRKELFDWGNLLGSSSSLLSFSKKLVENKVKQMSSLSVSDQPSASSVYDLQAESRKNTPFSGNKTGSSLKLTNLLRNISSTQRNPDIKVGHKRINEGENKREKMHVSKKVCNTLPQSTAISDASVATLNNTVLKKNTPQIVVKKDEANKNLLNKENKENINSRNSNSLSGVQSQLVENNQNKRTTNPVMPRGLSQNLMSILSIKNTGKERKAPEFLQKNIREPVKAIINESANNKKILQNDQQKHYNEGEYYQNTNTGRQNQQFEEMPVETNTLPLSQADLNMSQIYGSPGNLVLSGGSDLISPNSADLDEATRFIYQRIAAETPIVTERTKVPMNAMSNQKPAPKDNTVRSQYFTNISSDPQSLNTPPDPQAGDFQSLTPQPYSPIIDTGFDKTQSMDINSPPPANTDAFGGSVPAASNPSAFSFMSNNTFKSGSSVFDLF